MSDYIEREAAEDAVGEAHIKGLNPVWAVRDVPTADVVQVVYGRWEQNADDDWYCTNCGEPVAICDSGRERTYRKPYCPNCGAKMKLDNRILYPF
mgnify:CR=1 FL=1